MEFAEKEEAVSQHGEELKNKIMHTNNYILYIKTEVNQPKFLDFFHADGLSDLQKIGNGPFHTSWR